MSGRYASSNGRERACLPTGHSMRRRQSLEFTRFRANRQSQGCGLYPSRSYPGDVLRHMQHKRYLTRYPPSPSAAAHPLPKTPTSHLTDASSEPWRCTSYCEPVNMLVNSRVGYSTGFPLGVFNDAGLKTKLLPHKAKASGLR